MKYSVREVVKRMPEVVASLPYALEEIKRYATVDDNEVKIDNVGINRLRKFLTDNIAREIIAETITRKYLPKEVTRFLTALQKAKVIPKIKVTTSSYGVELRSVSSNKERYVLVSNLDE